MSISEDCRDVAIIGGYGGWNVGDEAILYSLVGMLRERGFRGQVHVICSRLHDRARAVYEGHGWRAISMRQPRLLWSCLAKNHLLVGGGQIVNGRRPLKSLGMLGAMVRFNRAAGNVPCVVGVGVNDTAPWLSRQMMKWGLCSARVLACRDQASLDCVRVVDTSKGTLTADVVFAGAIRDLVPEPMEREHVLLAVCHSPEFEFQAISVNGYARLATHLADVTGLSVRVVAHDNRGRFDAAIIDAIQAKVDATRVRCEILVDLQATAEVYRQSQLVISQRMHPLIIGNVLGTRVMPIRGSSKVAELCKRLGWSALAVTSDGFVDETGLEQAWASEQLNQDASALRDEAYGNAALICDAWKCKKQPTTVVEVA